ncbi:hypothetical protein AABB24_032782, partial [Solanum stoloniferum]
LWKSHVVCVFCFFISGRLATLFLSATCPPLSVFGVSLSMAGGNVDVLDIYPLNHYYFGSKESLPLKEEETLDHRIQRLKFNYNTHGIRTCVQAVLLVSFSFFLFQHS